MTHKDQTRVAETVPAFLEARVSSESDEAVLDCTLVNRLFNQGPDPLFIMHSAPSYFAALCSTLGLSVEEGEEAIVSAHNQGPGVFLREDMGLDADNWRTSLQNKTRMKEALWLVLAGVSDCTEGGYPEGSTFAERLQRAMGAVVHLAEIVNAPLRSTARVIDILGFAMETLGEFKENTVFTEDPRFGKPMGTSDECFYVGYKLGHPCVAMKAEKMTFYGTIPSTTLEAEGVTVDKPLAPQFGIVFEGE